MLSQSLSPKGPRPDDPAETPLSPGRDPTFREFLEALDASGLSVRGRKAIHKLLGMTFDRRDHPDDQPDVTRETLRAITFDRLLKQRNCGRVTANAVLIWLGAYLGPVPRERPGVRVFVIRHSCGDPSTFSLTVGFWSLTWLRDAWWEHMRASLDRWLETAQIGDVIKCRGITAVLVPDDSGCVFTVPDPLSPVCTVGVSSSRPDPGV